METTTVRQYADAVMRRSRVAMEPADFVPDWGDRPRKAKFFPGADLVPLPAGDYPADATVQAGLTAPGGPGRFTPSRRSRASAWRPPRAPPAGRAYHS